MTATISFSRRLSDLAQRQPDAPAITFAPLEGPETTLGFAALDAWVEALAQFLTARGARPGRLVVFSLPNGPLHFALALAVWRCGACSLPLSPRAPQAEFEATVALLDTPIVIADRSGATVSPSALPGPGAPHGPRLPDVIAHPGKAIGSGGSTGRPKIIVDPAPWARVPGALGLLETNGIRPGQVQLVAGPLYHNSPFSWAHLGLFEGHRLILMERFDAARAVDLIERHRIQFGFMAPTMMARIANLDGIDGRDLGSIESILQTAAACPGWLKRRWIDLIGPDAVIEAYGSSEGAGFTLITGRDWLEHPGSVGRATGCALRILGEDGQDLPTGEVGEVYMRPACHPIPTYRYIGAEPTKTTPDGFVSVGDLGHVDAEGWLYLADRRTDLIITGGANVYPAEVEAALTAQPGVADAVVIGLPDPDWGKRVHAIVEPAAGTALDSKALTDALRETLAPYKLPKTIEFLPMLPRDESGKIRRAALAAERSEAVS
ncbi:AMP-binding protein [Pararhodobacter sp.]|uniref:AMP-binding protein n=1 Tax=Pararhodobacter sp. TaxID=2127056 RepID=UPI002AFFD407|nr:AMP-binding protein [Pararhodobacter sp.]